MWVTVLAMSPWATWRRTLESPLAPGFENVPMSPLPSWKWWRRDGSMALPNLSVACNSVGVLTVLVTVRKAEGSEANAMPSSGSLSSGSLMACVTSTCWSVGARRASKAASSWAARFLSFPREEVMSCSAIVDSLVCRYVQLSARPGGGVNEVFQTEKKLVWGFHETIHRLIVGK